jgi:capsular polysaccharide biosynthesis protein
MRGARKRVVPGREWNHVIELFRRVSPASGRFGPPKGTFSAYGLLRDGELAGGVIMEEQSIPPIPADGMRIVSGLNQHRHQPWPVFWTHHTDARLIGATLALMDSKKRACLEAMYVDHHPRDPAFRSLWRPRPIALPGNWTSVVSLWTRSTNFYHWLMDAVPRLAVIDRFPYDTRVLTAPNLRPFQSQTLDWLGLGERHRPTPETHVVVESYFFSAPTAMTGCTNPYAVAFLRDRFLPRADSSYDGPDRVYVFRRGSSRGIINDEEVETFLAQRGWAAIDPETLPLAQQIRLFAGARAICGVHGAALTNIVWCNPRTTLIELIPDNYLNGCFESISSCLDMDHRYLVFPGDRQRRIHVDLNVLERALPP